jgi:hypothetical protein
MIIDDDHRRDTEIYKIQLREKLKKPPHASASIAQRQFDREPIGLVAFMTTPSQS